MTVKTDRMDTKITISVALPRQLERDLTCTTALGVLDCGASGLARSGVFALGTVWHGEDKINVRVKAHRNIEIFDRELVTLARRYLRATATTLGNSPLDTFGLSVVNTMPY